MMRALIVGAGGQLGRELQRTAEEGVEVLALQRSELDVTDATAVRRVVADVRPAVVLNAAGYTAVDRAEVEVEEAFAVNARGAESVARAAAAVGARIIHVSTDFVFDGESARPYRPDDEAAPLSTYGRSKLAGERAVLSEAGARAVIVRAAWLYSTQGRNFVTTILRLLGERERLRVVVDQIGTPTWAQPFARALWRAASRREVHGVLHWTDAGVASWYDFAEAIREEAIALRLIDSAATVVPIRSIDYPLPARRPMYAVLDKTESWEQLGDPPAHWRAHLRRMLGELHRAPDCTVTLTPARRP